MTAQRRQTALRSAAAPASIASPFDLGWRNRTASAVASPKLAFAWEPFQAIAREVAPLLHRHYRETGSNTVAVPLDLDFAQYIRLSEAGVLHVLTARHNGKLVGYLFSTIGAHLNFVSTVFSTAHMYYLLPSYRRGWNGVHLFREWIKAAENSHVRVLQVGEKLHTSKHDKRVAVLLKYLGFTQTERNYTKLIGE